MPGGGAASSALSCRRAGRAPRDRAALPSARRTEGRSRPDAESQAARFAAAHVGYLAWDVVHLIEKVPPGDQATWDRHFLPLARFLGGATIVVFDALAQTVTIAALDEAAIDRALHDLARTPKLSELSRRPIARASRRRHGRSRRRGLQDARAARAGVHRRRRRVPDRARAHVLGAARRARCVRRLSRDAAAQSVAVHVLPRSASRAGRDASHAHRRREPRDDGAPRGRHDDGATARRHAAAAARRPRRTSRSRRSSSPTRRSAPSTSCSSISGATTSGASRRSAPSSLVKKHGDRALLARDAHRQRGARQGRPEERRRSRWCAPPSPPERSSGAPKVRAMQIIRELEARPRGIYGGAIGYVATTSRPRLRHRDPDDGREGRHLRGHRRRGDRRGQRSPGRGRRDAHEGARGPLRDRSGADRTALSRSKP